MTLTLYGVNGVSGHLQMRLKQVADLGALEGAREAQPGPLVVGLEVDVGAEVEQDVDVLDEAATDGRHQRRHASLAVLVVDCTQKHTYN